MSAAMLTIRPAFSIGTRVRQPLDIRAGQAVDQGRVRPRVTKLRLSRSRGHGKGVKVLMER